MESRSTISIAKGLGEEYKELGALACYASPEGERCLYFPQGHLQQIGFSTNIELDPKIAHMNLPSMTLCRTLNIGLLIEENTKDIYLCYDLLPETETDPTVPDPYPPVELEREHTISFFKNLMASSTRTCGGLVNTTEQSMLARVLATYSYAISTNTMFTVHYKLSASPFVIPLNKYLEAVNNNMNVGMKFKMRFQSEDAHEICFFGTVVDIGDFSAEWPNSTWRCLKVRWDEPSTIPRPHRVSPWEIQPVALFDVAENVFNPMTLKSKSFKPAHIQSSGNVSYSPTSPPETPLWNESSSLLPGLGKGKASLNDSSSFLYKLEMEKCSTSAFASFCNWLCCCFK